MVAWCACAVLGCGVLSGLDQIQESDCAPNCDDGDGSNGSDGTVATQTEDASSDVAADGADVSGCGPLDTRENCSACGKTCAPLSGSVTMVSCSGMPNGAGAACQYMCATGHLDCNATTAPPDLDGCECAVMATATISDCCGGGCPILHTDNGFGKSYYECSKSPLQIALAACAAFTGDRSQCSAGECTFDEGGLSGDSVVCSFGSPTDCVCWDYSGPDTNFVHDSGNAASCLCPDASADPPYN
jgi:hypothetical protein